MKVLLISVNTEQINILPLPLGLHFIAGAAREAGHEVTLIDLLTEKNTMVSITRSVESFSPEIIGISVRNIDDQNMVSPKFLLAQVKNVVTACRKISRSPVVLGGAGYSIFPESSLHYLEADMGIQGEGEIAFPLLLERIQQGRGFSGIPGLYVRGLGLQGKRVYANNLDALPFSGIHVSSLPASENKERWMPVQTRRGCPMKCNYCSTPTIEGSSLRKRRPESVIEEISRCIDAGFQWFHFVDNTFNLPLSYAKELCRKLISGRLKIFWRCILYPGKCDKELIDLLARSGCREVSLGFESGSVDILRTMNKQYDLDDVRRLSSMLKDFGIRRQGFLLLGGPGETRISVEKSLSFADSLDLEALKITVGIRIYPNTALAKTAVDDGLIHPEDNLLFPKFYIVETLKDWLSQTVNAWMAVRPHWIR